MSESTAEDNQKQEKVDADPDRQHRTYSPDELLACLDDLAVAYELHRHEAVFTVQESAKLDRDIQGAPCRNLYLRDKKKRNFLVTALNETPVDLKALQKAIECGRFSFGSPDRLWQFLGVRPGSVCPFAVVNDPEHHVQPILDKKMMEQDRVNYHPLLNTMTVGLKPEGLMTFMKFTGHEPIILDLEAISTTS